MSSSAGPSRLGRSSCISNPSPARQQPVVKHEFTMIEDSDDSGPEVIVIDEESDSDVEFLGTKSVYAAPENTVIPLSPQIPQDEDSDEESIPEGFELWDPNTPVMFTVRAVEPQNQAAEDEQLDMAWNPPAMNWMYDECTGSRSAGAFIEPQPVRDTGGYTSRSRRKYGVVPDPIYGDISVRPSRPLSVRTRARCGPITREMVNYLQTSYLYSRPIVRIPGMTAPRGAVNYIAQSRGYIAVGRTYEEAAAYDGGGLALWRVKDQKAREIPAHITRSARSGSRRNNLDALDSERKQHSVATLSFDPADNLSLVSAGHDNTVQHWRINEEDDTVECVGSAMTRKPGYLEFHPEGRIAAVGCGDGLQLFDTYESLKRRYFWQWKRKGQETVSASWGTGRSRNTVVGGTQHKDLVIGKLVCIDAAAGKVVASAESEACSRLAVDPTGTITAFTGSGRGGNSRRHILRLYDVQRTGWHGTSQIGIPSSKTEANGGEVIDALWSPDGIHLACAREDNSVDVFDTRWLGQKQCMLVFKHDSERGSSAESYGVQGVAWFGSEKLVSGGADHCVRAWDVRRDESCKILATLGGGVGYLIGSEDPELFPIVVGDLLGNTYYLPNPQLSL